MNLMIGLTLMCFGIIIFAIIIDKLTFDPTKAPSSYQPKINLPQEEIDD